MNPFTPSANVYRTPKRFLVHPLDRLGSGASLDGRPYVWLDLTTKEAELGQRVLEALLNSRDDVPLPTDWKRIREQRYADLGIRSEADLMRGTHLVAVRREPSRLVLVPYENGGSRGERRGFHELPDRTVEAPGTCNAEPLGRAVLQALERALPSR